NSFNNTIHHNNFIDNGINAYDNGINKWNTSIGNYWYDYSGIDENEDGIGDTPYEIGINNDKKPLMNRIEHPPLFVWVSDEFTSSTPGWNVDHFDDIQNAVDAVAEGGSIYVYWGSYDGVEINKEMNIIAEENTLINSDEDGLLISSDNVTVKNFLISADENGIKIMNSCDVIIEKCNVTQSNFGLYAVNSINCSISNSNFYENIKGIYLFNSSKISIFHCRIYNNSYFGVEISHGSVNNQISDCHIENNGNYGVYITQNSNGNKIYHNNFVNNSAYDICDNEWGSTYEHVLGNYWSDYKGEDLYHGKNRDIPGRDGIGDTPYEIEGGEMDAYPLMQEIILFPKRLTPEEIDNKWALICVSANDFYEEPYYIFPDMDGFPAQGLQAYYTLKANGYPDDHIIFMLWHDNDNYVSIYGGHNDLLGPPPKIGGPNEPPEIDYDHNTPLPSGVNNWYELLQYNVNWLASNVGPDDEVLIYLINHGNYNNTTKKGVFCFEDGSPVLPEDVFDDWIDNISCKRMTILIDTCFSGDFIDAPIDPGFDSGIDDETNRILVSAAGDCAGWYYLLSSEDNWAGSFFFHPFFEKINRGESIRDAYEYACSYVPPGEFMNLSESQNPQLIDNIGDSNKYNFVKRILPDFVWVNQIFNSSFPGWGLDHFTSINEGVTGVMDGGGCFVFSGIFEENVNITKKIYLSGMQKEETIVEGNGISVFDITGNNVEICHFGIRNCWNDKGIAINADNITVSECGIYDNYYGVYISGKNITIEKNKIYENSFIGLVAKNTNNSIIKDCNIYRNNKGLVFSCAFQNRIEKNEITNNSVVGLEMSHSSNNTIRYNTFNNSIYGVCIEESSYGNLFYLNSFVNNEINAYDNGINKWNTSIGNYWYDYSGIDENEDGIGDTPYEIDEDTFDYLPLIRMAGFPVAYFNYTPPLPSTFEDVIFNDKSIDFDGYIVSYTWNFGDGSISHEQNPSHQYEDNGTYYVNLTIVDNDGNTHSIQKEITVLNTPPVADFSFSPEEPSTEDVIQFN
ncbi:MAG TPA: PKD domain-containing protein, partial [Thermoplasmatales archaeon]|nr:PKD domain-containing protein [Thermoplasmatales archaeon]